MGTIDIFFEILLGYMRHFFSGLHWEGLRDQATLSQQPAGWAAAPGFNYREHTKYEPPNGFPQGSPSAAGYEPSAYTGPEVTGSVTALVVTIPLVQVAFRGAAGCTSFGCSTLQPKLAAPVYLHISIMLSIVFQRVPGTFLWSATRSPCFFPGSLRVAS